MGHMTLRRSSRRTDRRALKRGKAAAVEARGGAVKAAETTRDWAAPKVEAARDWAGPKVEPAVHKVKDDVLPKVAGAVAAAVAASEPAREEARSRGSAAVAALRGEIEAPKPKKHRLRKLFLVTSVIGAGVAAWKAWAAKSGSKPEPWAAPISGATGGSGPTPASTSASDGLATASADGSAAGTGDGAPVAGLVADDAAGASPDEALADESAQAGEVPAPPTTEKVTPKQSKKVKDTAGGSAS